MGIFVHGFSQTDAKQSKYYIILLLCHVKALSNITLTYYLSFDYWFVPRYNVTGCCCENRHPALPMFKQTDEQQELKNPTLLCNINFSAAMSRRPIGLNIWGDYFFMIQHNL